MTTLPTLLRRAWLALAGVALLAMPAHARCIEPKKAPPLKLLIVTGGHDYEPVAWSGGRL